jgi:hypothetical protein
MVQDSSWDARTVGYIMVFNGVLNAGMAVDRIFFHKTFGQRWLTATAAFICLVGGTWMIIKRRAPLERLDNLAKDRWGSLGSWLLNAVFAVVVLTCTWLLSRLN